MMPTSAVGAAELIRYAADMLLPAFARHAGHLRRIADLAAYKNYYGDHHAPELLKDARFVLPELTPPAWKTEAKLVAAPGCYPTSILVPLVPLLKAGVVTREHIVVNAYSGVSGAGRKVDENYLYVERAESTKAYSLVKHRHLAEVEEQLTLHTGAPTII